MGIKVPMKLPSGDSRFIDHDVLGVIERIQKGDATKGWEGDPSLFVRWNKFRKVLEVWRLCEDGEERIILSRPTHEFDARVLEHLALADSHRFDVLARVEKEEEKRAEDMRKDMAEWELELADRLKFIANRHASGSDDYTQREADWYVREQSGD